MLTICILKSIYKLGANHLYYGTEKINSQLVNTIHVNLKHVVLMTSRALKLTFLVLCRRTFM